ncbi:hypothetical protein NEN54_24625 [Escherichia coli]|nr:hypothetical protein [Escherichia coli]MEB7380696.1 hypothetical protein [Escherichia coli]
MSTRLLRPNGGTTAWGTSWRRGSGSTPGIGHLMHAGGLSVSPAMGTVSSARGFDLGGGCRATGMGLWLT